MSSTRVPVSNRGRVTRAALVRAAREVFERDGFLDARITDITAAAGMAAGTFYTYFTDKDEIFTAVLKEAEAEMLRPGFHNAAAGDDPVAVIEQSNRAYLVAYRDNARLMRLLEQVAAIDEGFRKLRLERSEAFHSRNASAIARLQEQGLADPKLDPELASVALSAMVSRTAYGIFALGSQEVDFERLVQTVTRLWVNALRLEA